MASLTNDNMRAALTGKSASVAIPRARDEGGSFFAGSKTFATVLAKSMPSGGTNAMLPTPPNSISPSLPPYQLRDRIGKQISAGSTNPSVESDLDIAGSGIESKSEDYHKFAGSGTDEEHFGLTTARLESAGAITPSLLAKHHLPDVLIQHGPLAIRHLMGHLTSSVPGFSRIPPAKARRLVVGALEGHSEDGQELPLNPDIIFEKVGWGKWDARKAGQPRRERLELTEDTIPENTISPPPSLPSYGHQDESRQTQANLVTNPNTENMISREQNINSIGARGSLPRQGLRHEDFDVLEHEADKMSLDGDHASSSSEAASPDRLDITVDDNPGDETDDEDWRSIGAEALRKSSMSTGGGFRRNYFALRTSSTRPSRSGQRSASHHSPYDVARSAPSHIKRNRTPDLRRQLSKVEVDAEQRAAIEALLSMSGK